MRPFRLIALSIVTSSLLLLAACESDSEKAERFFQSGLALIEQGDKERALLEFRNVFKHDGFHREARALYAAISRELGRRDEAYSQYLRLIEQYPDATDARVALAEMAIVNGAWGEVERHTAAALEQDAARQDVQALNLVLQYRQGVLDKDSEAQKKTVAEARDLLAQIREGSEKDNYALVRLVLDSMIGGENPAEALPLLETALERDPDAADLNMMKARLLERSGDAAATGEQLRRMVVLFPENEDITQAMINWYLSQNDIAGAEAFLRSRAGADDGPTEGHTAVIGLLRARVGDDAARAEIERLMQANAGTERGRFYAAMIAAQDFDDGRTDAAISDLQALVDASEPGKQRTDLQLLLARMLNTTGERDAADALVKTVLETDAGNVAALKLEANRLIELDRPGAAIIALRRALNQNPRDVETLTLMARAHQRDGDTELAGERLALAVEASGGGAPEAIRYARFLISQGQAQVALTVLEDARRRDPGNPEILALLGTLALQNGAWQQAQDIVRALRGLGTEQGARTANELQAAILQGQNRIEDSLRVLEEQVGIDATDSERVRAASLIVQTQIRAGKIDAARSYLDTALAEMPDSPDLKLLDATLSALGGDMAAAEAGYRDLVAQYPQNFLPARLLINVLAGTGDSDGAQEVLEAALERMPDNPEALLMMAGSLEREGDIEGAIAAYEKIYAQDSGNLIIANNLASLITSFRDDGESLTRAANIARRLRGTQVPAFQDTYGWISYRRGNPDEALEYLVPAAQGLPNDPLVQFHLGMTYAELGRTEDAVGSSRVDLQACKLEYSIVSPK